MVDCCDVLQNISENCSTVTSTLRVNKVLVSTIVALGHF